MTQIEGFSFSGLENSYWAMLGDTYYLWFYTAGGANQVDLVNWTTATGNSLPVTLKSDLIQIDSTWYQLSTGPNGGRSIKPKDSESPVYRSVDELVTFEITATVDPKTHKTVYTKTTKFDTVAAGPTVPAVTVDEIHVAQDKTLALGYYIQGPGAFAQNSCIQWVNKPPHLEEMRISDTELMIFDHNQNPAKEPKPYKFSLLGKNGVIDPTIVNKGTL